MSDLRSRLMEKVSAYEALWTPVAEGVSVQRLHKDASTGQSTMLMRMKPGSAFPPHVHSSEEQCLVIEGDAQFDGVTYQAGDFMVMAVGTAHSKITTQRGNLLLLIA